MLSSNTLTKRYIMDERSGWAGFGWVCWVRKCDGRVVDGSVDSGCYKLSENSCFVWFKRSYSGQWLGRHACGRTKNAKIGLEFCEAEYLIDLLLEKNIELKT